MSNSLTPEERKALHENVLDSQSAACSIKWLFERYDASEHEISTEAIRLLVDVLISKLDAAIALTDVEA